MLPEISPEVFQLTIEQDFFLTCCQRQMDHISIEELRYSLLEMTRQIMIKDNLIQMLVKSEN